MTTKSFPYDQNYGHIVSTATIGANTISNTAHIAAVQTQVFAAQATVLVAGVAGDTLNVYHVTANSGSNTFSNTLIGSIVVGANVAGNTVGSGPLSANAGGVTCNVGDMINIGGNNTIGIFAVGIEYAVSPGAVLTA